MQGILISADIESLNCLGMLDIPVQKNRIHSLHVLFTLYSEFKNSQVSFCMYLPRLKPLDQYNGAWASMGFQAIYLFSVFLYFLKLQNTVCLSYTVYLFIYLSIKLRAFTPFHER
jgi:hypothetical protein